MPELAERDGVDEGVDGAGEEDSAVLEEIVPEREGHTAYLAYQQDHQRHPAQQEHGANQEDGQDDGKGGKGGGAAERVGGGYHQHAKVAYHHQDDGEDEEEEKGGCLVQHKFLVGVL